MAFKKAERLLAASAIGLVLTLACVATANSQVKLGDRFHLTMNGNLGASYEGNFGNDIGSSHGMGLAGNGDLNGYYYDPGFLSFHFRPYYDRVQSNADSQMITRGSGLESSVNVFSGGHFPGSVSYGRDFSSNSEFRIAGVPSVLGDSSGSNLDIAWSALFKGYPSLHVNYLITDTTSTLLGTTDQSSSSSKSFSLNSDYKLVGFNLHGTLNHYNTDFVSPSFLTGETIGNNSSSTNYGVTAVHRLPLSGSLALGWARSSSENGNSDSTTTNSYNASAIFSPWSRLVVSENWNYTTNVLGAIAQSLGDTSPSFFNSRSGWSAMFMNTMATLMVGRGITLSGHMNHRIQYFDGNSAGDTQYGGSVNFRKVNRFFGFLYFSVGIVDTATQEGNSGVGLVTNFGMMRKFGRWDTSADFSYSQDTQTLLNIATTSNYSYGGSLRRKINPSTSWSCSFRDSRSALTAQPGTHNISEAFATSLSWKRYSFSGTYSRADGLAVLGPDGSLTATPLGPIISNFFLTFNARSYGANFTTRLLRPLTLFTGYTNVSSSTVQNTLGTFNNGDRYDARLELRMRRLNIFAGFDRAMQTSSVVPGGPKTVNSYYVSLSRWFNVF